jgi:uncharacterized membrane protein YjgN (DUF898 family)
VLISHTGFGDLRASIGARIRSFYRVYVVTFVLMMAMGSLVGIIIGVGAVVIGALGLTFPPELIGISVFLAVLLFYGSMFFASGYFRAERTNLIYGTTRFSNHRLRSNLQFKAVGWLFLSNTIAIIFSLGLLIPYAQIRMTRYQLGMMSLQATNLDQITANNQHEEGALGESMIDAFDLDIGL